MRQLGVKPSEEELAAWIKLMYSLKTTTAFNEAVDILLKERQVQIGQLAHMTNVIREFFDSHSKMVSVLIPMKLYFESARFHAILRK